MEGYLPLSAVLGGLLCGASERCCVPETLHVLGQDSQSAYVLISLCEIFLGGGGGRLK